MKLKKLLPLLIAIALAVSAVWVLAQEEQEMTPEQKKMMEVMMKYGTPGPHHKLMEPFIGEWNVATKWWSEPGTQAQESNATSKIEWIMDGRYMMEKVEGMMDNYPFKGMSIVGYDNFAQKYNSLWIDNMSTMFFLQTGTASEDGKLITMQGTYDDIFTGTKNKVSKTIIRVKDNDSRIMEMYDTSPNGEEYMSMELTYTRMM